MHYLIGSSPHEAGTIIISIFQIRKLKFREICNRPKVTQVKNSRAVI